MVKIEIGKEWINRIGWFCVFFLVIDIAFVFWGAILNGGNVCVGDTMEVLMIEFYIMVPIAIVWLLSKMRDGT